MTTIVRDLGGRAVDMVRRDKQVEVRQKAETQNKKKKKKKFLPPPRVGRARSRRRAPNPARDPLVGTRERLRGAAARRASSTPRTVEVDGPERAGADLKHPRRAGRRGAGRRDPRHAPRPVRARAPRKGKALASPRPARSFARTRSRAGDVGATPRPGEGPRGPRGRFTLRFLVREPNRPGSMSRIATSISSPPCPPRIWKDGPARSGTSTSTVRESSWPARSCARSFSRVPTSGSRARLGALRRLGAGRPEGGSSRSRRRSSARASAFCRTSTCFSRRTMSTAAADEVADDRVHVAAHVADLGELARLDLDEGGCPGKLGEAARDLGLPDPGRPDHQDVLRRDVGRDLGRQAPPPDAAAQRDRHRALRGGLADHPAVELGHDLARGEGCRGSRRRGGDARHPGERLHLDPRRSCRCRSRRRSAGLARRSPPASSAVCRTSARAAARAIGPPLPTPRGRRRGDHVARPREQERALAVRDERGKPRAGAGSGRSATPSRARPPRAAGCRGTPRACASKRWMSARASAVEPAKPAST